MSFIWNINEIGSESEYNTYGLEWQRNDVQ